MLEVCYYLFTPHIQTKLHTRPTFHRICIPDLFHPAPLPLFVPHSELRRVYRTSSRRRRHSPQADRPRRSLTEDSRGEPDRVLGGEESEEPRRGVQHRRHLVLLQMGVQLPGGDTQRRRVRSGTHTRRYSAPIGATVLHILFVCKLCHSSSESNTAFLVKIKLVGDEVGETRYRV